MFDNRNPMSAPTGPLHALGSASRAVLSKTPILGPRIRRKEAAEFCPRCMARGTLCDVDRGVRNVQGKPILTRYCNACSYEFPAAYSRYKSVSFSTVGMPCAGQADWVLSLYYQVKMHRMPPRLDLKLLPSDLNAFMDSLIESTLLQGILPAAPQPNHLPDPLVFYYRGRTRLFNSGERAD